MDAVIMLALCNDACMPVPSSREASHCFLHTTHTIHIIYIIMQHSSIISHHFFF